MSARRVKDFLLLPEATALTRGEESESGSKTNSTLDRDGTLDQKRNKDSLALPFTKSSDLQASSDSVFSPIPEGEEDEEEEEEDEEENDVVEELPEKKIEDLGTLLKAPPTPTPPPPTSSALPPSSLDKVLDAVVTIQNGDFSWEEDRHDHTLNDISTRVPKGKLTVIVGTIGSGKSSLISALLGEMKAIRGEVQWAG